MTHAELDTTYTALAEAIARAGEARAPLLLATLALSLLAEQPSAASALAQITQAERLSRT